MTPRKAIFRSPIRWLLLPAFVVLGCTGTCFAQGTLVADSPFAPAGAVSTAANGHAEAYELAGSTVQGADISVCIFERQKKHSQWIPVGGDVDGIHVISYDVAHDTAVVTISGTRRELSMRKAVVASTNPSSFGRAPQSITASEDRGQYRATPVIPEPAASATTAAQDQKEARMLVSDLLEIGVQQRKAYQEAKLKAAQGAGTTPSN
jgi:hypothetical protein